MRCDYGVGHGTDNRQKLPREHENKFYTKQTNSGIISNKPKSLGDYDKETEALNTRLAALYNSQYWEMRKGDEGSVAVLDEEITATENQRDDLKAKKSTVLVRSGQSDKDMLRSRGYYNDALSETPGGEVDMPVNNNTQFSTNNMQRGVGLNDGSEEENHDWIKPYPKEWKHVENPGD